MSYTSMTKNTRNNMLKNLQNEVEKLAKGQTFEKDERFWAPTLDAAGNGSAIMRFLMPPLQDIPKNEKGELEFEKGVYFVKTFSHGFKGPTGLWYIEESPKTVGLPCPVTDYNRPLWETGLDSDKKKTKPMRTFYTSNILIVKDPGNPENNGKVFLFKYGKKIYDKICAKSNPDSAFEMKPINPFDPIDGANFRYRRRKDDDFPNYDLSDFDSVSSIGSEAYIDEIWKKEYSLLEFLDPSKFKSYDELKAKFNRVMGRVGESHNGAGDKVVPIGGLIKQFSSQEKTDEVVVDDPELESFQALLHE
jgi:gp32 DNA binding protein like